MDPIYDGALDPVIAMAMRLSLALLFAATARSKLLGIAEFRATLANYRIVPGWMIAWVAWAFIVSETLVFLALLVAPTLGALGAVILLAVYTAALAINILRGRTEFSCGCGGPRERPIGVDLLLRNALLMIAGGSVAIPTAVRALSTMDYLTTAACVAAVSLLWLAAGELATSAQHVRSIRMAEASR